MQARDNASYWNWQSEVSWPPCARTLRLTSFARAVLLAALALPSLALADTLTLKNGDRITGEVVRKEGGAVLVRTAYAGEVRIRWDDVVTLVTDKPVRVQMEDGAAFEARLLEGAKASGTTADVPLRDVALPRIAYINPTLEQSGLGWTYERRLGLAANLTRGNTDSGRVRASGEFVARAKHHRYRLWAEGTRASEGGATTESNWRATGSYDWFLRPREFVYARAAFEHDGFRDLALRAQLGGGYGYQFVETADTKLSAQAGPDLVRAVYYGDPDETFLAVGWGLNYSHWLWSRAAQIYFDQTGFWSVQDAGDVVAHTALGVRVPLMRGLNATTELKVDYDSDPAPGTRSTDTTLLLGLGYTW